MRVERGNRPLLIENRRLMKKERKEPTPRITFVRAKKKAKFLLEFKFHYPLKLGKKRVIENTLFVYVPNQLIPSSHHQSEERFLRENLQSKVRLTTPVFSLKNLIDSEKIPSVLLLIKESLSSLPNRHVERTLLFQLRLFSCIFDHSYRTYLRQFKRKLDREKGEEFSSLDRESMAETFNDFSLFLTRFRTDLFQHRKEISPKMYDYVTKCDLRISHQIILSLSRIYDVLVTRGKNGSPQSSELERVSEMVRTSLEKEISYREECGYLPLPHPHESEKIEEWVRLGSRLKKWAQGVLYLEVASQKTPQYFFQIVASLAAAIAMGFAVLAQFYATTVYGSLSWTWIAIMIISYIFKDRIKEGLRTLFARVPNSPLASYEYAKVLSHVEQENIGQLRSFASYRQATLIPESEIFEELSRDKNTVIQPYDKLLVYRRRFKINLIKTNYRNSIHSFSDILQFNLVRYAELMDSSTRSLTFYNPTDGVYREKGRRLYSLHIFVKLALDGKVHWKHLIVVMNRKEIIEIREGEFGKDSF